VAVFNPLDHAGIPLDRRTRDWRELNPTPIDPQACEPYTRCRVITMIGIENAAIRFDRLASWIEPEPAQRAAFEHLRSAAARQRRVLAGLLPRPGSVLESALAYERAAVDIDVWLARAEPEPQRRQVYQCDALEDFDHVYRYTSVLDLVGRRAEPLDEVDDVLPDRSNPEQLGFRYEETGQPAGPEPLSACNALTMLAVEQQMTAFYDRVDADLFDPPARPVYREVSRLERDQVARHRPLVASDGGLREQLLMREYNECRMYHAFLQQETDARVRAVWELNLQLELGHLQAARDLLRRFDGREAEEVVGTGLPEPLDFDVNKQFLRWLLATHVDPDQLGSRAMREVPQVREVRERLDAHRTPDRPTDVVDIAIEQHSRIEALFYEIEGATAEHRQAPFDELVRLISDHEATEADTVHRLIRDRLPGGFDVARDLIEEERIVRQMLLELINKGLQEPKFEDDVVTLRDAFLSHTGHEERYEFPQLRERMPAELLRQLAEPLSPAAPAAT
jgi:hypothetical protein